MYGVIDIGSNTLRLTVYHAADGTITPFFNKKAMAGLAGYVDKKGNLTESGMEEAVGTLEGFQNLLAQSRMPMEALYVFATASLRNIENTEEAVAYIRQKTGLDVDIVTGEQEARLGFAGAAPGILQKEGLFIDIGGGSTELVFFRDGQPLLATSLPLGSLNMYTKHVSGLLPQKSERKAIEAQVLSHLAAITPPQIDTTTVFGVGGTIRATGKLNKFLHKKEGNAHTLPFANLPPLLSRFSQEDKDTLWPILKTVPDRIHTLLPGMVILNTIGAHYGCQMLHVSPYGIREGYLHAKLYGGPR